MNFKKIVSAVSALAISVSAFAGLAVTASATETNATLEHTASWSSNDSNEWTVTKDAAGEHYNNEGSGSWQGYAFAEFSFTIPQGETVSSATLTWSNTGNTSSRNNTIYYLNAGKTLNYDAISGNRYNDKKTYINKYSASAAITNQETDVSDAIKTLVNAGQSYVVFQWTANAGGTNLCGKASEKAPTLVITTSAEAYTVTTKYKDEDGNTLATDSTDTIAAGVLYTPSYSNALYDANYKYTYKEGGDAQTITSDTVITITYTKGEIPTATKTLYATYGDSEPVLVDTVDVPENATVTAYYSRYVLYGGSYYSIDASSPYFGKNFSYSSSDATIEYTAVDGNVVFFSEAETLAGASIAETGYTHVRASQGKEGYGTGVAITTLPAGRYVITGATYANSGTTITISAGETAVYSITGNGGWSESNGEEFTLTEATALTFSGGSSNYGLDYVLIKRTGDYVPPSPSVSATADNVTDNGKKYMTFDAEVSNLGTNTVSDCGFAFINLDSSETNASYSDVKGSSIGNIMWQASTLRENGTFGAAIAQLDGATASTIYAIPFIVLNSGNNGILGAQAVKSKFIQ